MYIVLGIEGDVLAVLVTGQHIDTAAVGGNPDVTFLVLHALIGSVAAQTVSVVVIVIETMQRVTATALVAHLEHAVVFRSEPIVAFGVHRDAIDAAYGMSCVIVVHQRAAAVSLDDEECIVLVGQQQQLAVFVVEHASHLVVVGGLRLGDEHRASNVFLQDFQLLQSSADG